MMQCVFCMLFSCLGVFAIGASLPLDLPLDKRAGVTVQLFGSIPAKHSVEDYVLKHEISFDKVSSLYYKTISDESLYDQYRKILVGEIGGLTMHINKKTKEIIDIELFTDDEKVGAIK